jgi:hypothetical protein
MLVNYRDHLFIYTPKKITPIAFVWQGESSISLPNIPGTWYFHCSNAGFSPQILFGKTLVVQQHQSTQKLKFSPKQSAKPLAKHAQEKGIAPLIRQDFLLLMLGEVNLFVENMGMNWAAIERLNCVDPQKSDLIMLEKFKGQSIQIEWRDDDVCFDKKDCF